MTDLTKLADALESYTGDGHGYQVDDAVLREAARILRSAAGVDVAGLMAMVDELVSAKVAQATNRPHASVIGTRTALESGLRLALAAREPQGMTDARTGCQCQKCRPFSPMDPESIRMILCAICGNKRCPHANDHRNACTNSNEPGQPGSSYPARAAAPKGTP